MLVVITKYLMPANVDVVGKKGFIILSAVCVLGCRIPVLYNGGSITESVHH